MNKYRFLRGGLFFFFFFNPGFLGCTAMPGNRCGKLGRKKYKVVYQDFGERQRKRLSDRPPVPAPIIYDQQGNLGLLMPYGSSPDAIAQNLKRVGNI